MLSLMERMRGRMDFSRLMKPLAERTQQNIILDLVQN